MKTPPTYLKPMAILGLLLLASSAIAGKPAIEGYSDYTAYRAQIKSIAVSEFASVESLGTTLGRREVILLRIGTGKLDEKPAVLVVGGVEPAHLAGSELAVRFARQLVQRAKEDRPTREMLGRLTFYVIPRPAPDACEAFFSAPYHERSGNDRAIDDDRDGETNEDGAEDLNGDGWITMMRLADTAGTYMPHPDDDRVMILADPKRDEQGRWSLYVEGRDNDEDEQHGEDGPGGVAFNRNFTHNYEYFGQGAGPHQVSEIETRAVADFAFSHPNIAAVITFTPEDNMMSLWKSGDSGKSNGDRTTLPSDDEPYVKFLAKQYREIHGGKDAPESVRGRGSFSEWAYFHYGRWSFACRGWWIPKVSAEEDSAGDEESEEEAETPSEDTPEQPAEEKPDGESEKTMADNDKRGAEDINALRWFAEQSIDGFVPWQSVEHPDFPGQKVEVGGFRPFYRINPPAEQLEALAEKHVDFVCRLAALMPCLAVEEVQTESLGGGVWRVTAVVINRGYLPTVSNMGQTTRALHPLQIQIQLPKGGKLVTGHARGPLPTLSGNGGQAEKTWLVRLPKEKDTSIKLRVWSPSVGSASKTEKLSDTEIPKK